MPLRLLIDECSIHRALLRAIEHISAAENVRVDVVCVGEAGAPPRGTLDPELIQWSIAFDRAIVSHDTNTMIGHYYRVLNSGQNPPPLLIWNSRMVIGEMAEALVLAAVAYGASDYGRVIWLP